MRVVIHSTDEARFKPLKTMAMYAGFDVELAATVNRLRPIMERDPAPVAVLWTDSLEFTRETVEELRLDRINGVILVLLATPANSRKAYWERTVMLMAGADDAQHAPISTDEFAARVIALARRSLSEPRPVTHLPNGATFDPETGKISSPFGDTHLTGKETALLMAIVAREGACVTKESLLSTIYGGIDEPQLKIVDVFVCKIRKKLELATGGQDVIQTIWGRGYSYDPAGFVPVFTEARHRAQAS